MHAAWEKLAGGSPDHLLSNILREEKTPSARDWYVATSVIQWLATNVGMTVLEAAGFSYQQWEQDRADGELFRRRQEQTQAEIREQFHVAWSPLAGSPGSGCSPKGGSSTTGSGGH
jgi:hypothetical protein